MYCNNCGEKISNQASFCPHCGAPVQQAGLYTSPVKKPASQGLKTTIISIVSAALIGFGVFAYFQWIKPSSNSPTVKASYTPGISNPVDTAVNSPFFTPMPEASHSLTANEMQILGAWEWVSEIVYYGIIFYDDGTALYVEDDKQEMYTYSISGNMLTMTDPQETSYSIPMAFETYYGDEYLVLTADDQALDFVRVDELHR